VGLAWARARHVEADPRDVYAQLQEQLRFMAQASMVGLHASRPRTLEGANDRSLEFTRYGLSLLRTQQMQMRVMKEFGVLAAIAGGHAGRLARGVEILPPSRHLQAETRGRPGRVASADA
jgi:hypothetical protein